MSAMHRREHRLHDHKGGQGMKTIIITAIICLTIIALAYAPRQNRR